MTYALQKQSKIPGAGGSSATAESVPRKNRAHTYDKDGKGSELIPSIPVGADGPATDAKLEKLNRKPYSKELLRLLRSMPGAGGGGGGGGDQRGVGSQGAVERVDHLGFCRWTAAEILREAENPRCEDLDRRSWKGVRVKLESARQSGGYTHCVIFAGMVDLTNVSNKYFVNSDCVGGDDASLIGDNLAAELESCLAALRALHTMAHGDFGCRTLAVLLPEHDGEARFPHVGAARRYINRQLREFAKASGCP